MILWTIEKKLDDSSMNLTPHSAATRSRLHAAAERFNLDVRYGQE
jgi:hypothetical protein